MRMPVAFIPNIILTDSDKLLFPFLFEIAKSYLKEGQHVHLITKNQIENVSLQIDKSEDPCVDSLSRLSIKYLGNTQQLVDYAIDLQFMLTRQGGKPPHAVLIQGLQSYFDYENYGFMALALLESVLKELSSTMNLNVVLIAEFHVNSVKTSRSTIEFLKNNFFDIKWRLSVEEYKGTIKLIENRKCRNLQIEFKIENDVIFMDNKMFLAIFSVGETKDPLEVLSKQ